MSSLFSLLPLLLCMGLCFFSCDDPEAVLPVSGVDAETLVENYNANIGDQELEEARAFCAIGTVSEVEFKPRSDGDEVLHFVFRDDDLERSFTFALEEKLDFPEEIDRAKVVFLGHQMIVADLDGHFYVHLYVPEAAEDNLLPGLPYVEGNGLGVATEEEPVLQES
ncbi:hypothetical protein [Neolewinella litorea]|uniref:Lipoprotein n=1 Tax=Neolewinella litorea TaxID=2562452 RepID=A0A4S4NHM5_9BACT|nr:hypothetical protein [Neolewinella litorea]THH37701.1 hypothetical protein E4021_13480 [Neolewinella litorea]